MLLFLLNNDARHQTFVDIAKKGDIDLLFVGDSITDWFYWPRGGAEATGGKVWEANFAPLSCRLCDRGRYHSGCAVANAEWRLEVWAKLIVLMLGTNNTAVILSVKSSKEIA
jgi:hypothetical protein